MNDVSFPRTDRASARPAFARWLGATNDVTRTFLAAGGIPGLINMAGGLPAPESYPAEELAALAKRAIEQHPQDTLGYGPVEGLPELRDVLAARFSSPELRLGRGRTYSSRRAACKGSTSSARRSWTRAG